MNHFSFLKKPKRFGNICKIYPPSVDQVLDDSNFPLYRKILTSSQEEIRGLLCRERKKSREFLPHYLSCLERS